METHQVSQGDAKRGPLCGSCHLLQRSVRASTESAFHNERNKNGAESVSQAGVHCHSCGHTATRARTPAAAAVPGAEEAAAAAALLAAAAAAAAAPQFPAHQDHLLGGIAGWWGNLRGPPSCGELFRRSQRLHVHQGASGCRDKVEREGHAVSCARGPCARQYAVGGPTCEASPFAVRFLTLTKRAYQVEGEGHAPEAAAAAALRAAAAAAAAEKQHTRG